MLKQAYKTRGFNASKAMCVLEAALELSSESWGLLGSKVALLKCSKSVSLCPCAAKTLARIHASAHRRACKVENVGFTHVL